MATAGIQLGITAVKFGLSQLAQHTARLQAATSENQAANQIVGPYDQDIAEIVAAFNDGTATDNEIAAACAQVDYNVQTYLKAHVGKPGTAWNDSVGSAGQCNKQCTVGCCLYYGDLGPPLSMIALTATGHALSLWGENDPRYQATADGAVIKVPEVLGSKYGAKDRPGYTITLKRPSVAALPQSIITKAVGSLLGTDLTPSGTSDSLANLEGDASGATVSSRVSASSDGLLIGAVVAFLLLFLLVMGGRK